MRERERENGFRCLPPLLHAIRPTVPCLPPLLSPLPVPHCSRRQPPPNTRLVLRNYRRISANTADEYLEDRVLRGWAEGGGWRSSHSPCCWWPAALKTSSNEAEDGSRDEGFLERGGEGEMEARRRRDVFTEQFGIKSPLERELSRTYRNVDNGGHNVKASPTK